MYVETPMTSVTPVDYRGQKVVVLGLGRQGMAMARFLARCGARVVGTDIRPADALGAVIAELNTLGVEVVAGAHPISLLDGAALVGVSGGVPLTLPIVQEARRRGISLVSDAELTLRHARGPVLAITGSAGKTTTTTLVGRILETDGLDVRVGGNIGTPALEWVPEMGEKEWLVLELSSFQLDLCYRSPRVAGVLNVTPNHLDRHGSMEAYAEAKRNIFRYQRPGDTVVLGWDNAWTRRWWEGAVPEGVRRLAFSLHEPVPEGAYLAGDEVRLRWAGREYTVCRVQDIRLRGRHNVANVLAAVTLAAAAGATVAAMREVVRTFTGVPHRLEEVRVWRGALWVNDSIATAPERVIAALEAFSEPIILIAGGRDKKLPWEPLARVAATRARWVIAFGEAAPLIAEVLAPYVGRARLQGVEQVSDLPTAVAQAAARVQPGEVVLLSPGGTSFDAYTNFEARGEHFRQLVWALDEEGSS